MTDVLTIADSEYLSIKEAAETLGLKPHSIRAYIYLGYLKRYKFKTATVVRRKEVEEYRAKLMRRQSEDS